jgi:hypothetical protein
VASRYRWFAPSTSGRVVRRRSTAGGPSLQTCVVDVPPPATARASHLGPDGRDTRPRHAAAPLGRVRGIPSHPPGAAQPSARVRTSGPGGAGRVVASAAPTSGIAATTSRVVPSPHRSPTTPSAGAASPPTVMDSPMVTPEAVPIRRQR